MKMFCEALPRRTRWRRRIPFALFLAALASLTVAAARPQATVTVPVESWGLEAFATTGS